MFAAINETADSNKPVQVEYAAPDDARESCWGKATILPEDNDNGVVMVIDDITVLMRAQKGRMGEVAKRLAHEIVIRLRLSSFRREIGMEIA